MMPALACTAHGGIAPPGEGQRERRVGDLRRLDRADGRAGTAGLMATNPNVSPDTCEYKVCRVIHGVYHPRADRGW